MGSPVLVDLPGHGRHAGDTAPERFTLEAVEVELLDLAGDGPLDLVGYSMGGRVALAFTARNPGKVRRLVLESSSPGLATEEERAARRAEDEALAAWILEHGLEAFVDRWAGLPLFESQRSLPGATLQAQRARRLLNHPASLAASLRGMGTGALPSFWGSLPEIGVPVLVLVGGLDRKFTEIGRRMAEAMPGARLTLVPDAGHTVHLERPDAWLGAVVTFLSQRGRSV